ncbi:hypothetical protein EVAR_93717_1 [Eumeta japonica]|uniref:Uncharacterized protein n=1 Tax=Eumeta variegata TaxID=151549 RepID=A0A4C1U2K2_EUMVA|nr:hypothetical protein EVAR_93717_1 [Eumeta japonica]
MNKISQEADCLNQLPPDIKLMNIILLANRLHGPRGAVRGAGADMCAFFARPRRPRARGYTPIITSFLLSIIMIGWRGRGGGRGNIQKSSKAHQISKDAECDRRRFSEVESSAFARGRQFARRSPAAGREDGVSRS